MMLSLAKKSGIMVFCLLLLGSMVTSESVTYDFDSVNVEYAAEFKANYQSEPTYDSSTKEVPIICEETGITKTLQLSESTVYIIGEMKYILTVTEINGSAQQATLGITNDGYVNGVHISGDKIKVIVTDTKNRLNYEDIQQIYKEDITKGIIIDNLALNGNGQYSLGSYFPLFIEPKELSEKSITFCLAKGNPQGIMDLPSSGIDYPSGSSWSSEIAPENSKINVLFGVVDLIKFNQETKQTFVQKEEFIKVEGSESSERFLWNSAAFAYHESGALKETRTQFWSAKKLVGDRVIKDFTEPIKSIIVRRKFDEDGNLKSASLQFVDGKDATFEAYETNNVEIGVYYEAQMETLKQAGNPKASAIG